jgi:LPS-assembly lipoprotein
MSVYSSSRRVFAWLAVGLTLVVSACGFQLQGASPLAFDTLLVSVPENTQFGADLRRAIRASSPDTTILNDSIDPYQAQLQQISSTRTSRELSLNAQGRVEEYELTLTYIFRIVDANGDIILPATTLRVVRNLPFDDRVVQAKEGEEATLFAQMQNSLIARIMRRISAPDIEARYRALIASNAPNASDVTNTAVPSPR